MLAENVKRWEKRLYQEGWTKGVASGRKKGEIKTLRTVVERMLTILFGTLTPGILALIGKATPETLYNVIDRLDPARPMAYYADLLAGERPAAAEGQTDTP